MVSDPNLRFQAKQAEDARGWWGLPEIIVVCPRLFIVADPFNTSCWRQAQKN
jgi:hypothetical protein